MPARRCRLPNPRGIFGRDIASACRTLSQVAAGGDMTDASARALVEGKGLSKWFEGSRRAPVRAVENVSFAIPERESSVLSANPVPASRRSGGSRCACSSRRWAPCCSTARISPGWMRLRSAGSGATCRWCFRTLSPSQRAHDRRCRAPRGHCPAPRRGQARGTRASQDAVVASRLSTAFLDRYPRACSGVSASVLRLPAHWRPIRGSSLQTSCVRP